MLRIGKIQLQTNLLLAPLAGYTDLAFRLSVRPLGGIGLACTDLISSQGLLRHTPGTMHLVDMDPADQPLAMQIYGNNPGDMARAAQWCAEHGAAVIDINMGCPAEKVCRKDGGVAVMRDPDAAVRLCAAVVAAVPVPVTAKMRLGWDSDCIVAPKLAAALESVGVAAITVHGRTGVQKFTGSVDLDGIARTAAAVRSIPVIGNGDIRKPQDAAAMIQRTGCAGIMIGRAAVHYPWIFRETRALLAGEPPPPPPTLAERVAFINANFRNLLRLRGEDMAVGLFRQRVSWYARNIGPSRAFREKVRHMQSADQFWETVREFFGPDAATL